MVEFRLIWSNCTGSLSEESRLLINFEYGDISNRLNGGPVSRASAFYQNNTSLNLAVRFRHKQVKEWGYTVIRFLNENNLLNGPVSISTVAYLPLHQWLNLKNSPMYGTVYLMELFIEQSTRLKLGTGYLNVLYVSLCLSCSKLTSFMYLYGVNVPKPTFSMFLYVLCVRILPICQ